MKNEKAKNFANEKKSKNFWLLKSEPETFSIDDLKRVKVEPWTGVRNYQARNNMMSMSVGDECFFYHSSCEIPAIVGICKVSKVRVVDELQFDSTSEYFDPKSTRENPRWFCIEVKFLKKFTKILPLSELKQIPELRNMNLLQKGSRLSVQPVKDLEFQTILKLN